MAHAFQCIQIQTIKPTSDTARSLLQFCFRSFSSTVSCIVYLNENWTKNDGGELRVYPFPYSHEDIAPLYNRMVIFSSPNSIHRVLPSYASRSQISLKQHVYLTSDSYCFTIWLSGDGARRIDSEDKSPTAMNPECPWASLLASRNRKHIARLLV